MLQTGRHHGITENFSRSGATAQRENLKLNGLRINPKERSANNHV
jgi:hypothetical protein